MIRNIIITGKEYCRYSELPADHILTYIVNLATAATSTETLTVDLVQEANGEVVATQQVTPGTVATRLTHAFNIATDCYDAGGIYRAREGFYHLRVRLMDTGGVTLDDQQSSSFPISVVSVGELKRRHMFGFPGLANDVLMVVQQPKALTGVTVDFVSQDMYRGDYQLQYAQATNQLTLANPRIPPNVPPKPVTVDPNSLNTYTLPDAVTGDYLTVTVEGYNLPTTNVNETIIVDNWYTNDAVIREYLWEAKNWVEGMLHVTLEPTRIATDASFDPYRHMPAGTPLPYYPPMDQYHWLGIDVPHTPLLEVIKMQGWFSDVKSLDVPKSWRVIEPVSGRVDFVPRAVGAVQWYYYGPGFLNLMWGPYKYIPRFWHFAVTAGCPELTGTHYAGIRELVMKRAMIQMLTVLGSAYRGGVSSESVSKDGVGISTGFTSSASLNVYGADITVYERQIADELPRIRQRVNGLMSITVG